jgi:hypothetical protein
VLSAVALLGPVRAHAQTCHPLAVKVEHETPLRAHVGLQIASYQVGEERGTYQALYGAFAYQQRWFGAELMLPAYRLDREGDTAYGLGDLVLTVRGTALSLREDRLRLGVEVPVSAPTGDPDRQLGMGHVMFMPALWFALSEGPFALQAQLGYGRVLGKEDAHAHHAAVAPGRSPIVNPMNREELEHALAMRLDVQRYLAVQARWFGAVPIGEGVTRQVLGGGIAAHVAPWELLVELQVPVAGDPFVVRLVTQVGVLF